MSGYRLTLKGWDATVCPDCGDLAFSCPCAVADNTATGQGDDVGWHNHDDAANPL